MLSKIEHIALAVSDLEESIRLYTEVWGLELEHREVVEDQGVEEAMFRVGDSYVQLLAPLSSETTVGKFIAKRGEGLHHIAYEVADLDAALASLAAAGARLIDEKPRRGSRGTRVAFVHPAGNRGVLVELVERA
jgi:methylmalonyl-CoA/ethylmalonyl-CoA epimerase